MKFNIITYNKKASQCRISFKLLCSVLTYELNLWLNIFETNIVLFEKAAKGWALHIALFARFETPFVTSFQTSADGCNHRLLERVFPTIKHAIFVR